MQNFYDRYVQFGECRAEIAAALILGLNPSESLAINTIEPRIIVILDPKIKHLFQELVFDDARQLYNRDLFFYVERALSIKIQVHNDCLTAIMNLTSSLPKKGQSQFKKYFPNLVAFLNNIDRTEQLSLHEKHSKWQETANLLYLKMKSANKKTLAESVLAYLKKYEPHYIQKNQDEYYPASTIVRNIKLPN